MSPSLSADDRRALTRRYQDLLGLIGQRTTPLIAHAWGQLTSYRDPGLAAFTAATATTVTAAKAAAITTASGYHAVILGTPAPQIALSDIPAEYNARSAFLATWKGLNDGLDLADAADIGLGQAEAATENLIVSSARQTGDVFADRTGVDVTGWMRVAEATCCPWCGDLDGVIFTSSDAADFGHDRCRCIPEPVTN